VSETVLTNEFRLDSAPSDVFEHLTTPSNYIGLSPLVVAVEDVDTSKPGIVHYTSVERFRFLGLFTYDNRIDVVLRTEEDRSVYGDVRSPGGVRVVYRFDLSPDGAGTRMSDRLELSAPWFLIGFASREARKVQLARARVLADRLNGSQRLGG
jgi:hypothetical protein